MKKSDIMCPKCRLGYRRVPDRGTQPGRPNGGLKAGIPSQLPLEYWITRWSLSFGGASRRLGGG
jgi:hypothetical protein